MREPKSRVDALARGLRRAAIVLVVAFVVATVAAISWVDDEFIDPPLWRYATAVADGGIFLVAAVIAWASAAIVETLARVRASLLDALEEPRSGSEYDTPTGWSSTTHQPGGRGN